MTQGVNGRWVVGLLVLATLAGGLLLRWVGLSQWEATLAFYESQRPVLQEIERVHADLRVGRRDPARLTALQERIQEFKPLNGRTRLTRTRQLEYVEAASKGLAPAEKAYGVLVGRLGLEFKNYRFTTAPAAGTVPPVTKRGLH